MMRPKLVIFDCDGVLVDSEGPTNEVLARSLGRYGLDLRPDECMDLFVGGTMASVGEIAAARGAVLPDNWIDEIYAEVYDRLRKGVPPIAGIRTVLDRLDAEGVRYCVASNGAEEKMGITLGHTGLLERFTGNMFSAHALGVAKPDPGLYLQAAQAHDAEPSSCVVIEDSLGGALAAKRAGMVCFGYAPHGDGHRMRGEGARIFHDMRDLIGLLGM